MRKGFPGAALLLLLLAVMIATTACGKGKPVETATAGPSLNEVKSLAETALNASLPTQQRQQARTDAMTKLLALLRQSESTRIAKDQWEQKVGPGGQPLVRYFESGRVRVYALALPGSGVVPPGERVAIQYVSTVGSPTVHEVEVMPGGALAGAMSLDDRSVLLAFSLARGGGYLGHYHSDRSGEYQPDAAAFRGIPATVGEVRLEPKGNFLVVDVPADGFWRPQFDLPKQRFYVNADLGLEWKGKYNLIDDRSFTAFQGFLTAANPNASKQDRQEAWEKATRKLPTYLSTMESLTDDIASKLPPGGRVLTDQTSNLTVRVVSMPAPEGVGSKGFTVVQHRTGGLPSAQVVTLPGVVESFKVASRDGLPGLVMLTAPPGTTNRHLTLMRVTGANDWEPAPDWYGFLGIREKGLKLSQPSNTADLVIEGANVSLEAGGAAKLCTVLPDGCFSLVWVGGRLSGAGWVGSKLQEVLTSPGVTLHRLSLALDDLRALMQAPDTAGLRAGQLASLVPGNSGVRGWDPSEGTRVLALPYNDSGVLPLLIQNGKTVVNEYHAPGAIRQWTDVREVQVGGARWLLALGRSPDRAALLLWRWNGQTWEPANALNERADRTIGEWSKIVYTPGQGEPVRGLYVTGHNDLRAAFTPDGNGVAFCEADKQCTTYQYVENRWVLK